ncbi:MAG: SOS response-associated peptidase family protein, partial [Verrucomicrobiota bacterium]
FAGLSEEWLGPESTAALLSCAILTTAANDEVSGIHDRMPVLLNPSKISEWLNPRTERAVLSDMMASRDYPFLENYPVSDEVNRPINDHKGLVIPFPGGEEPELF